MYLLLGLAVFVIVASGMVLYFKMNVAWILVVIGLPALALGLVSAVYPSIRTRWRFSGRPDLTDEAIYDRFYSTSGLPKTVVLLNWRYVASALGVPRGRLRPQDRLDAELSPQSGWQLHDEALADLLISINARLTKSGEKSSAANFTTLDDIIRCLVALDTRSTPLRTDRSS